MTQTPQQSCLDSDLPLPDPVLPPPETTQAQRQRERAATPVPHYAQGPGHEL